jgi:osmotically-inducible protein OsmY
VGAAGGTAGYAQVYTTNLVFNGPTVTPAQRTSDVQGLIGRSSALPSRGDIQAVSEGNVVILRGTVATDQERRLAEAIARLTPGVVIRNELQLKPAGSP